MSLIWGAENPPNNVQCALNVFTIDPKIRKLNGYVIDPYDSSDLLKWVASIAICRTDKIKNWLMKERLERWYIDATIDRICKAYDISEVEDFLSAYDWIISKRSDDGLWRFITEFFSDNLSLEGLRRVYLECSFGDQLVLKTDAATSCLEFDHCEFYDSDPYLGEYDRITAENARLFADILLEHDRAHADFDDVFCSQLLK